MTATLLIHALFKVTLFKHNKQNHVTAGVKDHDGNLALGWSVADAETRNRSCRRFGVMWLIIVVSMMNV
uniref:DOMON domain-containing protein n=1 Tax=Panagrellus redivivus TaxID=6233 RepID=A0A7E4VAM5_PANRE